MHAVHQRIRASHRFPFRGLKKTFRMHLLLLLLFFFFYALRMKNLVKKNDVLEYDLSTITRRNNKLFVKNSATILILIFYYPYYLLNVLIFKQYFGTCVILLGPRLNVRVTPSKIKFRNTIKYSSWQDSDFFFILCDFS